MNAPCMYCDKRSLNCHSVCKKYKEYRKKVDKINEKLSQDYEYRCYLSELFERGQA